MPGASGAASQVAPRARERYLSLDVFRGMTVAGMLLVNTPGSWSDIYPPLRHAPWHGWTPTDLIFPFFLFVVGITTHISATSATARGDSNATVTLRILRRGAIIVLLGLLVSAFPYFPPERITEMRIPGVLQRIGVCYTLAALLTVRTSVRAQVLTIASILLGYWFVMTVLPVPGQPPGAAHLEPAGATMAAWVDRLLLDGHLWSATRTWDPEGALSTIPAIATVMLGTLVAKLVFSGRPLLAGVKWLAVAGFVAIAVGLAWDPFFPINKNIWTSSYVLLTGGIGAVILAGCIWLIDLKGVRWWTGPFEVYGLNPIVAFVGSALMARSIYSLIRVSYEGSVVPVQTALYKVAFESWLAPRNASLLFAVCFVLLWLAILMLLKRRNIVIRV
jgi:predicted acyltransferase